jgi:hypothetical protein
VVHKLWANGFWADWESLGGGFVGQIAATSLVSEAGGVDLWVRGYDDALYNKRIVFDRTPDGVFTWPLDTKSEWQSFGGGLRGSPSAVSRFGAVSNVAVRGSNDSVFDASFDGVKFSGFRSLGGGIVGSPTIDSTGRISVQGTTGALASGRQVTDSRWEWTQLEGAVRGSPTVASAWFLLGPGPEVTADVFVKATDDSIAERQVSNRNQWSTWISIGGKIF